MIKVNLFLFNLGPFLPYMYSTDPWLRSFPNIPNSGFNALSEMQVRRR